MYEKEQYQRMTKIMGIIGGLFLLLSSSCKCQITLWHIEAEVTRTYL
jgi:hypothetical protein